jgi:hypothetical protein
MYSYFVGTSDKANSTLAVCSENSRHFLGLLPQEVKVHSVACFCQKHFVVGGGDIVVVVVKVALVGSRMCPGPIEGSSDSMKLQ